MNNNIHLLLSKLDKVKTRGKGQWMACCPAHEDSDPSLAIKEHHDGRILVKCFAGCGAADVVASVGLSLADLFPEGNLGDFNPFGFAVVERKKREEAARQLETEKLVLDIAEAKRQRGEQLSAQDKDRELQAYIAMRQAEANQ